MTLPIVEHVSLSFFNTFGVDANARYFLAIHDEATLLSAVAWAKDKGVAITVLGEGSNVLFTGDIDGLVLVMQTQGIDIVHEEGSRVIVEASAGVIWNDLVQWCVRKGLGGVENLSLIYGTVGAAPVQNIGAYGVEFKDVCYQVKALNKTTGEFKYFSAEDCCFSYRDSIFKHQQDQWIITQVQLILDSQSPINISYAALQQNLPASDEPLTYQQVSKLVSKTRQQRLPDPKQLGNAGSFFKNPIVSLEKAEALKAQFPDLVMYPYDDRQVKLAAGWLIDKAGLKGVRKGYVGTYPKQALVIVNYGDAEGRDILKFAQYVQHVVQDKFDVALEPEPVFYPQVN